MIGAAVSHYWDTRLSQQQKQEKSGKVDYGLRGAVTGGAQMDGFLELFTRLITSTGMEPDSVHTKKALEHAKHRDLPICTILFSYNCIRNKETTRVHSFGQKSGTRYWAGESHGTVLFCLSRTGVP